MFAIYKRKEWDQYAMYMNPVLIRLMGGKEGFTQMLKQQMDALGDVELQQFKNGKILQLFKVNEQYQCIAETFLEMKYNNTTISGSSYDYGVSEDGVAWTFFRVVETLTPTQIYVMFPDMSPDIKLPRAQFASGKTLEEFLNTYTVQYLE